MTDIRKLSMGPVELEWLSDALGLSSPMSETPSLEGVLSSMSSIELHIYPAEFEIIREGDQGSDFFIVKTGSLSVLRRDSMGRPAQIGQLGIKDFFGEISFLLHSPRSATVKTDSECGIFRLSAAEFAKILGKYPELDRKIKQLALERLGRLFIH